MVRKLIKQSCCMFYKICYKILKFFVCRFHQNYYQRIEIIGLENIPENVPIIFAPNHQNAIMDALILVCALRKPVLFMARGDFFYSRIINSLLRFIHIIPVYRKSEGLENISKNADSFQIAIKELQNGGYVCIMPEAGHQGVHYIRPLSKGIFRLATSAQQYLPDTPMFIVPVGIFYSSYYHYHSSVFASFGNAIRVQKFTQDRKNSNAIVINSLKGTLYEKMKTNIIHIQPGKFYEFIDRIAMFVPYLNKQHNSKMKLSRQVSHIKNFTNYCNQLFIDRQEYLIKAYEQYKLFKNEINYWSNYPEMIADKDFNNKRLLKDSILAIVFAPFTIIILTIYALPLIMPEIINRFITDKQFYSSVQFVVLFVGIPIWLLILFFIWLSISNNLIFSLILLILACFSFKFVFLFIRFYKQLYIQYKAKKVKKILLQQIIQILDSLEYKTDNHVAKN